MPTLRAYTVITATLLLVTVACGSPRKDTGLPTGPTAEPVAIKPGTVRALATNLFDPKETRIKVGDEVTWEFVSVLHNAEADDGSFNSHPGCAAAAQAKCSKAGDVFKFKFAKAGEFVYFCAIHGFKGGLGMSGKIIVET